MKPRKLLASILAAALAATGAAPASLAASPGAPVSIGVAGAVKGVVRALPPSGSQVGRVVQSGKPLFLHEHVTTGPGGHLQIMLNDETIFSIGPDSNVVLDEFVYDPATNNGKVSASVTKGVFRFITGNIGKKNPSSMEVKLPAGTIGIRGTIVAGRVTPGGPSMVVLLGPGAANTAGEKAGAFNLNNAQGSVLVDKPGFGSTLPGAGIPPTPPAMIPPEQLKAVLADLAPKTMADRAEQGKQMMAERLAQKLAGDKEPDKGAEKEEGGPRMSKADHEVAEKLMAGEPLTPEEQALARQGLEQAEMPEAERRLAEKLLSGETLTPEDQQKMGMMMAGAEMLEQLGPEGMTPEQMRLAQDMRAGNLTPEQQESMMRHMSPEQQSLLGELMMHPGPEPGMDGRLPLEGDMPAMGDLPPPGENFGDFSAFGDLEGFPSTDEFFNTFVFDPNIFQCQTCNFPPGTTPPPASTWDAIIAGIPSGTAVFPGQSGSFFLDTCKGGGCAGATGTWNFSNVTVNFGTKMISGSAGISASHGGSGTSITDSVSLNTSFSGASGPAVIDRTGSTGFANYHFQFQDAGGVVAKELQGNVFYNEPNAGGAGQATRGGGPALISTRP